MESTSQYVERFGRPLGYLTAGVVSAAVLGWAGITVGSQLETVVYDGFYLWLGPFGATKVATVGSYVLAVVAAVAAPAVLAGVLSAGPLRATGVRSVVLGQLGIVAFAGVGAAIHPLLVVGATLCTLGLLSWVVVRWYRVDSDADARAALAVLTGGLVVAVPLLLAGTLVPLEWNTHTVVATEVPQSEVSGGDAVDLTAVDGLGTDPFTTCEGNQSTTRTCYRRLSSGGSRAMVGVLDDHGIRCPYETGVANRSVLARVNGSYYRLTCETLED